MYKPLYFTTTFLCLWLLPTSIWGWQDSVADSILNKLQAQDTATVNALVKEAKVLAMSQPKESIKLGAYAVKLANQLTYPYGLASAYDVQGKGCFRLSQLEEALINYTKALEIAQKHKLQRIEAQVKNNLGVYYASNSDFEDAIPFFLDALEIHEQLALPEEASKQLQNLSGIYYYQENYEKSLAFVSRAIAINEQKKNYRNLAYNYISAALSLQRLGRTDEALKKYRKALPLSQSSNNKGLESQCLSNIAVHYLEANDGAKAIVYAKQALAIAEEIGNKSSQLYSLGYLLKGYLLQKDITNATSTLIKTKGIANSMPWKKEHEVYFQGAIQYYEQQKNFQQAFQLQKDYLALKDTLDSRERSRLIHEYQAKYDLKILTQHNERLSAENQWHEQEQFFKNSLLLVGGLLLFITIGAGLLLERQLRKAKRLNVELEHRAAIIGERNKTIENLAFSEHDRAEALTKALNQLKEAQVNMMQAEKMASLGIMTAGIAHEINNPINFVSIGTDLVKNYASEGLLLLEAYINLSNAGTEEEIKEARERINKVEKEIGAYGNYKADFLTMISNMELGVQRVSDIVKGLATFSRREGKDKTVCYLPDLVEKTLVILRHKYKGRIEVICDFDTVNKAIYAFPSSLSQVILNLVVNAIDATPEDGKIIIATKHTEKQVVLTVSDTGMGMPELIIEKIFDPFFTTKEVGKGTGLGLSIVYGIIQQHDGTIEVRSEEGKGTTFMVSLPNQKERGQNKG